MLHITMLLAVQLICALGIKILNKRITVMFYGYVYGVASQKRYIGQVHRFGALCTAPNSVHWCTEFGALVHRIQCTSAPNLVEKCTELGAPSAPNSVH